MHPTISPLVRLPGPASRDQVQGFGNEVPHWTNSQLSHWQEREESRRTPCGAAPCTALRTEAVTARGHRDRTERVCPVRGSWGLGEVQIQSRTVVPDAQSVLGPGLVSLPAPAAQTRFLPAESSHLSETPMSNHFPRTLLSGASSEDWPCQASYAR